MVQLHISTDMKWESETHTQNLPGPVGKINSDSSESFVPLLGKLRIPRNIYELLWLGVGGYDDNSDDEETSTPLTNENCRFSVKISMKDVEENEPNNQVSFLDMPSLINEEPSLINVKFPVDFNFTETDCFQDPGHLPSYRGLNPKQRGIYLTWLCDVRKPLHISYVFLFYYGLERHLLSERYRDAINTILTLRQNHTHSSFMTYSEESLIVSAILHKDKSILAKILENFENANICREPALLGKLVLKRDLSAREIISIGTKAGFKNKTYITGYPDIYQKKVESVLLKEFGKNSFPFYNLSTGYFEKQTFAFANCSFHNKIRFSVVPSIEKNPEFLSIVYSVLLAADNAVKTYLMEQMNTGIALKPENQNLKKKKYLVDGIVAGKFRPRFEAVIQCYKPSIPQNFSMKFTSSTTNCLFKAVDLPDGLHYEFDDWQNRISVELHLNMSKQPLYTSTVRDLSHKTLLNLPQLIFKTQGNWLRLQFFFDDSVQPSDIANAMSLLITQTYPTLKRSI